jgi:hypothetical protein
MREERARPHSHVSVTHENVDLVELARRLENDFEKVGTPLLRLAQRLPRKFGLRPVIFRLTDEKSHAVSVYFPMRNTRSNRTGVNDAYVIQVSSDALKHALSNEFGLSTLVINGRFEASDLARENLYRWSLIGLMRASNQKLNLRFVISNIVKIIGSI